MTWRPNKWESTGGDFEIEETGPRVGKPLEFDLYQWGPWPDKQPSNVMRLVTYIGKFPTLEAAQQKAAALSTKGK